LRRDVRKAAIATYKERKADVGIYVVRCAASGQQWVGSAPDLRTIWNRLSFTLRQGAGRPASLQEAWTEHGAGSFTFDVIERVDPEDLSYSGDLRDRVNHWRDALPAEPM
jgi:hypothetical protein